jgi:ArsR family transcriptional regulator
MKHPDGYGTQAELLRALAHPVRLRILDILSQQEACVCHLTAILGKRQPYVSQQLATLREAGLVTDRREGTLIYYQLADEHVAKLLYESRTLTTSLFDRSMAFPEIPEALVDCPCPRCQG